MDKDKSSIISLEIQEKEDAKISSQTLSSKSRKKLLIYIIILVALLVLAGIFVPLSLFVFFTPANGATKNIAFT